MQKYYSSCNNKAQMKHMHYILKYSCAMTLSMKRNKKLSMEWELMNMKSIKLSIPIMLDSTSLTFSMTVTLISLSVMMFTVSYMSTEKDLKYFTSMVMMFILSMNTLIFSPQLITLLMGWDGLGLTSYLLVVFYSNHKSMKAGMITALTNRLGDALLLITLSWALTMGHWNMTLSYFNINLILMTTLTMATMTKSAQMPFSAWLPAAMAAPTPVSALVHSSTLVTAGIYLMIRFYPSIEAFPTLKLMCFYLGTATCLMASTSAMYENDMKKVIALSTLSQLGLMMMTLGLEQPKLAFFHLITHAMLKALLFICAGTMIHNTQNNQDIRTMGMLSKKLPMTATAWNTSILALMGFPFLSGFYSKDSIMESFMITSLPLSTALLVMISVPLTAAYSIRLSTFTQWSLMKNSPQMMISKENKMTTCAYLILITGTVLSGTLLNETNKMSISSPTITSPMKMMVITLIITVGLMMHMQLKSKKKMKGTMFMNTMWFLDPISSPLITNQTLSLSKKTHYNEMTWMEDLISYNSKNTTKTLTKTMQIMTSDMTMTKMMTTFSILMIILMLMN
nr:NADH dehydrogenase subunit 5 [Exechonella vieirai]